MFLKKIHYIYQLWKLRYDVENYYLGISFEIWKITRFNHFSKFVKLCIGWDSFFLKVKVVLKLNMTTMFYFEKNQIF